MFASLIRFGCIGLLLATLGGCSANRVVVAKVRTVNLPHQTGKGLAIVTENGKVEIIADPQRSDVEIRARITATAATGPDAEGRWDEVQMVTQRREDDGALEAYVVWPGGRQSGEGCEFAIRVPDANGVYVRSSNGSVLLQGLGGTVDVETSNGGMTFMNHSGAIKAKTSNGSVKLDTVTGDVVLQSSNGQMELKDVAGKVEANTSNSRIRYEAASTSNEPFKLTTSNGSVEATVSKLLQGRINASTSNGRIKIEGDRDGAKVDGKKAHEIILTENGPTSIIKTSNSNVTVNLR